MDRIKKSEKMNRVNGGIIIDKKHDKHLKILV